MFQAVGKIIEVKTNTPSQSLGLAQSLNAAIILAKVTEYGNGRWQATRFRKGRLLLIASSAIEAQELYLQREIIKKELNELFNENLIKQVIVKT
jgi:hypothetical protein